MRWRGGVTGHSMKRAIYSRPNIWSLDVDNRARPALHYPMTEEHALDPVLFLDHLQLSSKIAYYENPALCMRGVFAKIRRSSNISYIPCYCCSREVSPLALALVKCKPLARVCKPRIHSLRTEQVKHKASATVVYPDCETR